jgi:two-component system alkaline phosphatase synthesis response regulator PhoP
MNETERPSRILVVEDEPDLQALVCRILSEVGHTVDVANDGGEALRKIDESRPDLVVLDLMMPGVDGWEVLARLRTRQDPPPVVVLTAHADSQRFTRGVKEGAAGYVFKPFRFQELITTCEKTLAAHAPRPPRPEERRRENRRVLMVHVEVLAAEGEVLRGGEMHNISPGGAQVDLQRALDPGSRVRVAFDIPADGSPVALLGRVLWREPIGSSHAHGLVFEDLSADAVRHLEDLLSPPS